MPIDRIKDLMWETAANMEKAKSSKEWEKFKAIYDALKNQWNKKTGNKLIYKEV